MLLQNFCHNKWTQLLKFKLDEAVSISNSVKTIGKDTNHIILPPTMGK